MNILPHRYIDAQFNIRLFINSEYSSLTHPSPVQFDDCQLMSIYAIDIIVHTLNFQIFYELKSCFISILLSETLSNIFSRLVKKLMLGPI